MLGYYCCYSCCYGESSPEGGFPAVGNWRSRWAAREMLGLPMGATVRIKPSNLEKYIVFVQSTSANRKLIGSTRFLYEVEDWDRP